MTSDDAAGGPGSHEGVAGWSARLEELRRDGGTDHLAELAVFAVLTRPALSPFAWVDLEGWPSGRPADETTLAACRLLLERCPTDGSARSRALLMLGHLGAAGPLDQTLGEQERLDLALHHASLAAEAADGLGTEVVALTQARLARLWRDSRDLGRADAAADRALDAARDRSGTGRLRALVLDVLGPVTWLRTPEVLHAHLHLGACQESAAVARLRRDYAVACRVRDEQISVAAEIVDAEPYQHVAALGDRAVLARSLGDVIGAQELMARQRQTAHEHPTPSVRRRLLSSQESMAVWLGNWSAREPLAHQRMRLVLGLEGEGPCHPDEVAAALPALRARGDKRTRRHVGNIAYDLAADLASTGQSAANPTARASARAWLDVAEEAWRGFALNGVVAIGYRRVELDAIEGMRDPSTTGTLMVEASRRWRRAVGQRTSAIGAARWGEPGDPEVIGRLLELLSDAPEADAPHLSVAIAQWHLRAVDAGEPDPEPRLREALRHARDAAAGLRILVPDHAPVYRSTLRYLEACRLATDTMARLRDRGAGSDETSETRELALRLESLPAVAQRLLVAVSAGQRRTAELDLVPWIHETLRQAVRLGHRDAADAAAEVLRRDRVGSVLASMAASPTTPHVVAEAAQRLVAVFSASVTADGEGPAVGTPDPGGEADLRTDGPPDGTRAVMIDTQRRETLDVLGQVVGPVARDLFDPTTSTCTARDAWQILARQDPNSAVLSLVLVDGDAPVVVRHLVMSSTEGPIDLLDEVPAPRWLVGLGADGGEAELFARVDRLGDVLLPPPLLAELRRRATEDPLALTVVPTGLLDVPLVALPVDHERLLLDVATVSVAQSLQTVRALAEPLAEPEADPVHVAVYDPALRHAARERAALRHWFPALEDADSLAQIAALLSDPSGRGRLGVLALAVHGDRADDPWRQVKRLPSGEVLSTGHVLQWYLPRTVVGSSCNTDLRADSGGDLGGFPLAFQLRGAATIVGTLYYVEDDATASIMELFFAYCAGGRGVARALRDAQLAWTSEAHRRQERHRWAYLVAYGTPGTLAG